MGITTQSVNEVMIEKGFWNRFTRVWNFESWSVRDHLLHVLDELDEYMKSDETEEAADVVIVILDLLGHLGYRVDLSAIESKMSAKDSWHYVAEAYHQYRKTDTFNIDLLLAVISDLMELIGSIPLIEAVEDKMEKNKKREHQYGVAK